MIEKLEKLINSLNCIEVSGKRNLDILLGCILALEQMKTELNKPKETEDGESIDK